LQSLLRRPYSLGLPLISVVEGRMYYYVTGVVVNLILVGLGAILLGEKVSIVNAIDIAFCILGVALISHRS